MTLYAEQQAAYADDAVVGDVTRDLLAQDAAVLQVHLLDPTVEGHIAKLLAFFDPYPESRVVDIGCGVGAVAAGMCALRPDLDFVLVNRSRSQLELCPPGFELVEADFHQMPLADDAFDAAMLCYVIGHGDLDVLLRETARVLKPGGVVLLYDFTVAPAPRLLRDVGYMAHNVEGLRTAANLAGFLVVLEERPPTDTAAFRALFGDAVYSDIFGAVTPILMRLVKR